jgi:HEAT repeat protein
MKLFILFLFILQLTFSKADQDDPGFKSYFKGYQLVLDGKWDIAIKEFKSLISKYPKSKYYDDAFFWSAYAQSENGDYKGAVKAYTEFIKSFPESNLVDDAKRNLTILSKKYPELVIDKKHLEDEYDSGDEKLQEEAVYAISQIGGEAAKKKLLEIAKSTNKSNKVREKAIFWLGNMGSVNSSDLYDLFKSFKEERMKEKIIFSISQQNDKESSKILFEIIKNKDNSRQIREKALFWISQSHGNIDEYLTKLLDYTKDDYKLREKLMFTIYNSSSRNKSELLYRFATNEGEDKKVREKAIFWLAQLGSFEELKKLYLQINDEHLQEKMIFNFSQIKTDESIDFLIKLLKLNNTSAKIKKKIVFWLGQMESKKAREAILEILD